MTDNSGLDALCILLFHIIASSFLPSPTSSSPLSQLWHFFLLSYFLLVYFVFLFASPTPSLRSLTCSGKDGMLLPALQRRFSIGFLPLSYLCIEPRQERIP